jgi:thiamine-monophosphate kinase
LHAGIDTSDGLSLDLWRICQESLCGAVVDIARVPISAAAVECADRPPLPKAHALAVADHFARTPLQHALSDGEDFELILAVPPDAAARMLRDQPLGNVLLTDIGEFLAERRLYSRDDNGGLIELPPRGYEHEFE